MYEELVKRLREVADEVDNDYDVDPYDAEQRCLVIAQAADAIEELSNPRWIPVGERLPAGGDKSGAVCENVWLFFDDGNVYPGWMNGITEKVYYLDNYNADLMKAPISRVKMWQPRPEPPKEET